MKKARYTSVLVILILIIALVQWPTGLAIVPQDQTISIVETHDDAFITESGNLIDSQLCAILDPGMDIRSFLVFKGIEVNYWEPLTNATLRFRTTVNLDFQANSTVTIYGMRYSNLQEISIIRPGFVLSVPITSAHVSVNTSQFYGQQWHEVNVTDIVEELIRSHEWDGDGHDGTETGDSIGFVIFGAEGYDTRWFIDYSYGTPSLASQLVIHWNHEPPPPAGYPDAIFNETYRGYHIWEWTDWGGKLLSFYWYSSIVGNNVWYQNSTDTTYWIEAFPWALESGPTARTQQRIWEVDDWIVITADPSTAGSVNITWSDDYFTENKYYSLPNSNPDWTGLSGYGSRSPCLWIDEIGLIHMVYSTPTSWNPGNYNVIYFTFNILSNGSILYSDSFENVTIGAVNNDNADLYVEKDGTVHVAYIEANKVFYRKRWINETWTSEAQISTLVAETNKDVSIVASELKGDALFAWTYGDELYWNYAFSNMTVETARTTGIDVLYPTMVSHRDDEVTHLVYQNATAQPCKIDYTYKSIDNSSSWSGVQAVSEPDREFKPSIGIDETNRTIYAIWQNDYNERISYNQFQIGDAPVPAKITMSTEKAEPYLEPYPERVIISTLWIATDENGTNVFNGTTYEEVILDIEIELGADPEDPDPLGENWSEGPGGETGAFTRFRMRLWFLLIGFGCLFGPILFFAWKRPSGYYILCGAIVMLIGIGMLISIGQV